MAEYITRPARVLKRILVALGLFLAIVGVAVFMFVRGTLGVDDWVVRQVAAIAQTYIVPTMGFQSFDYQAPRTVELHGVTFTAPDGTRVINADQLTITLAEIPQRGRPIVIESVTVQSGSLRLERAPEVDGVLFKGLVPFVKRSSLRDQDRVAESVRLSSVLQLRAVRLVNAGFEYVDEGDRPPLRIDGFDLDLNVEESAVESDGSIWHTLEASVDKGRLLQIGLHGRVNIDTVTLELEDSTIEGALDGEAMQILPPAAQAFLRKHEAAGHTRIVLNGRVDGADPNGSTVTSVATLEGVNFAIGNFRVEVDEGTVTTTVEDGVVSVSPLEFNLYDGVFNAQAHWPLAGGDGITRLQWEIAGVQMEQMLRAGTGNTDRPTLAGTLQTTGSAAAETRDIRSTISGGGMLGVRNGRLALIPVIDDLIDRLSRLTTGSSAPTQRLDMRFSFEPDWVRIGAFDLQTDVFAATGSGTVGYDGSLDFAFRGGPLKRAGRSLGVVGDLLSNLTERAVSYRVGGSLSDYTFSVHPLGVGGGPSR
ncbi:MAG: hypothetical protein ACF8QF_00335 [Phycisphaerales bacterium]